MIDPSHNYPPGTLAGDEDRERRRDDDDEFWTDYWRKHGGTEPEDKYEQ